VFNWIAKALLESGRSAGSYFMALAAMAFNNLKGFNQTKMDV
jgi:hypothetical protein